MRQSDRVSPEPPHWYGQQYAGARVRAALIGQAVRAPGLFREEVDTPWIPKLDDASDPGGAADKPK